MNKLRFSGTVTPYALPLWDLHAGKLSLTRNSFIESVVTNFVFQSGGSIQPQDIQQFWHGMPRNADSNFTYDFVDSHMRLGFPTNQEALKFFYSINLIPGVIVSSGKQANFYKVENGNKEYLAYYAVGVIRNRQIDQYISNLGLVINTIGPAGGANDEFAYFSRMETFNKSTKVSTILFPKLLGLLNMPGNTDCLKVHYSRLHLVSEAIKQL